MDFIFDMDGVVVDTETQYDIFFEKLRIKYKLNQNFTKEIKGLSLNYIINNYFSDLPIDEQESILKGIINFEENEMTFEPIAGVLDFLKILKTKNHKIGLVTSSHRNKMEIVMQKLNLASFFDLVITSDDVMHAKPDPEGYRKAMDGLSFNPESTVVFEDSFAGIQAARSAGVNYIVGIATTNPRDSLKKVTELVVDDFTQLSYVSIQKLLSKH